MAGNTKAHQDDRDSCHNIPAGELPAADQDQRHDDNVHGCQCTDGRCRQIIQSHFFKQDISRDQQCQDRTADQSLFIHFFQKPVKEYRQYDAGDAGCQRKIGVSVEC